MTVEDGQTWPADARRGRPAAVGVRVEVFVEKLDLRHKVQMAKKSDTNVSDKSLERVGKNGGIKFRPTTYDRPGLSYLHQDLYIQTNASPSCSKQIVSPHFKRRRLFL